MAKVLEYNATMVRRDTVSDGLAVFNIKLDSELPVKDHGKRFTPGQYMTLGLNRTEDGPGDNRPISVVRPVSIASAPEDQVLQFYIRYVGYPNSDLPFTHLLYSIGDGARMYVKPNPTGRFTEEHTCGERAGKALIMLAAGTGLAPFMSIVRSKVRQDPKARLDDYVMIHGVSNPTYLGYKDELDYLAANHGLRYLPTISRPKEAKGWKGMVGRAEATLQPDRIKETEERTGIEINPDTSIVTICGLTGTISQALIGLAERGFVPQNAKIRSALGIPKEVEASIYYEQYDSEPVIDLKNQKLLDSMKKQIFSALGL
ncbi:MAG: hypothetical protein KTR25_09230 [Myxococcales bacterium]|nr:hypothetical protein [Myxococcales bacterium]